MLDQIRIVLVNTSHPGNIGAAARAMKTMGLSELVLVSPQSFPHQKALEMASGATDILATAKIVEDISTATAECGLIIGTSARDRTIPWPLVPPRQMAEAAKSASRVNKIAILFGREQTGLTNEELHQCHLHVQIPANPQYSSLNIAQAVQVIAYELRLASLSELSTNEWDYRLATGDELEKFFEHLKQVSIQTGFLRPEVPRQLMTRLRRLYLRAKPDVMEINILRGMLSSIEAAIIKTKD